MSKHENAKLCIFQIFSKFPIVNYRKSIKIQKWHISRKIDLRLTKAWSRTSTNLIACHQGDEVDLSSDVELCVQFLGQVLSHFLLFSRKMKIVKKKNPFFFRALNQNSDSYKMLPTYWGNFCMSQIFDLEPQKRVGFFDNFCIFFRMAKKMNVLDWIS